MSTEEKTTRKRTTNSDAEQVAKKKKAAKDKATSSTVNELPPNDSEAGETTSKPKARKKTTTKKTSSRSKKTTETGENGEVKSGKISVADIVVDRLIEKIESEQRLPWQKPFKSACMNWYKETEYTGVNKLLLGGGEYITYKQLDEYNQKNKTDHEILKGTKSEIVVFFTKYKKRISDKEAKELIGKGFGNYVFPMPDGNGWYRIKWTLRYYRVFNILDVQPNSKGEKLESKIGKTIFEEHTPAEAIVAKYTDATGVKIINSSDGGAWYDKRIDSVGMPERTSFLSQEAFYRVIFHELIHSTGIKGRLDRLCFHDYHMGSRDRSREELIAEIGGLLLATEAGFRDDSEWANNSMEYVHGWCQWMKDNRQEVVTGIYQAEKAKNYILAGGKLEERPVRDGDLPSEQEDIPEESVSLTEEDDE